MQKSHNELFKLCHVAKTMPPRDVMTPIAATTIKPAINAYSNNFVTLVVVNEGFQHRHGPHFH